jgi:XTP/dITP diphosphohydrolase
VADGLVVEREASWPGTVLPVERGEGGFGYDPIFVPDDGDGRTAAELSADEKNAVSHRAQAFRALAAEIEQGPLGR